MEKIEFKPFERILIRMEGANMWQGDFFSNYTEDEGGREWLVTTSRSYPMSQIEALSYEGNEKLLGTTDPAGVNGKLKKGDMCYGVLYSTLLNIFVYAGMRWTSSESQNILANLGRLFRTKEEAIAHRDKLNKAIEEVEK